MRMYLLTLATGHAIQKAGVLLSPLRSSGPPEEGEDGGTPKRSLSLQRPAGGKF